MSIGRAMAALAGEPVLATAITWIAPEAVFELAWGSVPGTPSEALGAVASAFAIDLAFVEGGAGWASEAVALLHEEDVAAAWVVAGVLSRVAARRGWSDTLALTAASPGELAYELDEDLHEALVSVREARAAGADAIVVADELASSAGWLVSPDYALDALVPCYARIAEEWLGSPAIFHSDGDVRALYPPLRRSGFAAVHIAVDGEQRLHSSVAAARSAGLCAVGGVPGDLLRREGVRRTAESAVSLAGPGPFIFADDGGLTTSEEVAAYGAVLESVRQGSSWDID